MSYFRHTSSLVLLLVGLLSCDGEKPADSGVTSPDVSDSSEPADTDDSGQPSASGSDEDEDGFSVEDGDCDDTNPDIHPDAIEVCDDIDNDCDGDTDDADGDVDPSTQSTWYADADADGYGSPDYSRTSCIAPEGHVESNTDCDDLDDQFHPGAEETCEDAQDKNCDGSVLYADVDGDGWAACTECDDGNATAYPGAAEVCDMVDNDCDGLVDDEDDSLDPGSLRDWYTDADEDGFGDEEGLIQACSMPEGTVMLGDSSFDCNDDDSAIFPDAEEVCDGLDNDCDDEIDESGATTMWYRDADLDGFGDITSGVTACSAPAGYGTDSTDCDDHDNDIFPGADELCDLEDNDCDGVIDEDDAIDARTWFADSDGDSFGDASTTAVSCDPGLGFTSDSSDCDDALDSVYPGAEEYCNDRDDDCDGLSDEADAIDTTIWYVDADGDGHGDPAEGSVSCAGGVGLVSNGSDCDDTTDSISPDVIERCNGIDDDCDGSIDESDAVDASTWYTDSDADGFGDPDLPVIGCEATLGTVADATDCDDSSATIFPGADEVYADGIDQDCDGEDSTAPEYTGSEEGWYFANYDEPGGAWDPSREHNGSISCATTCAAFGLEPRGARFVCNLSRMLPGGSTEGCDASNDGMYGRANCGWMMRDFVELTENGNTEDCSGRIGNCVTGSCSEGVTWHAIECQCR